MVRRAVSSPPSAATRRAADAAVEAAAAAAAAARAAEAAAEAVAAGESESGLHPAFTCRVCGDRHATSEHHLVLDAVQWPPPPSLRGHRFWFARGYPGLEDGIHTYVSLKNRGVDPEKPAAEGLLVAFKTADPTLRRAQNLAEAQSSIYWR